MATVSVDNRKLLIKLAVIAAGMFGFAYMLVPFYKTICEVTGINNLLQADVVVNTQIDTARTVTVEFDANINHMPWQFHPLQTSMSLHPGEMKTVMYEVVNTLDRPVTGQAVPSWGPRQAERYFKKMTCFCFTQQTLQPGEKRQMPVTFVVDPALPADVPAITLSYTFFEVAGKSSQ